MEKIRVRINIMEEPDGGASVLIGHVCCRFDKQLKTTIESDLSSDACSDISWLCDFWNADRPL